MNTVIVNCFLPWIREKDFINSWREGFVQGAIDFGDSHFERWEIAYLRNVMHARLIGINA
ncbi:MAG: hypothetical protein KGI54_18330 [Pseudomonadota bacterium]|nr:hypothetical protein [Pseudomonadota bacterium]